MVCEACRRIVRDRQVVERSSTQGRPVWFAAEGGVRTGGQPQEREAAMWDSMTSIDGGWDRVGAAVAERGGWSGGVVSPVMDRTPQPRERLAESSSVARRLVAVADDDPTITSALTVWLEHLGYETRVFGSGDALLDWARTGGAHVAAFVLDVQMEGRDGPTTCREIRGLAAYSQTPAVLMSSLDPAILAGSAREVGSSWVAKDGRMLGNLAACLARVVR
jgi:CheY-like chemotaxis protein